MIYTKSRRSFFMSNEFKKRNRNSTNKSKDSTSTEMLATLTSELIKVKLFPSKGNGSGIAYGSINIADTFIIFITVYEREEGGYFVAYPSYKNGKGEWKNSAYCLSKDMAEIIEKKVGEIIDVE